jgi:thiol-disulfide isomerase/thioredoxin
VEAELSENALPQMRAARTLWIDPDRLIVLRDVLRSQMLTAKGKVFSDATEEMRVSSYRINEDMADSVFQFEPPREAYRADVLNLPDSENGLTVSADNTPLIDLNGNRYTFKELRGRVIYLDFWATWCVPCLKGMAVLEKIYPRYKDKGLVIFGVNQQQQQLQSDFLKKKPFGYSMLYDRGGSLSRRFKAAELPTSVLIDRQGRVVNWEQGLQKQEDIENLLASQGIQ